MLFIPSLSLFLFFCRTRFTIEELKRKPPPEGVDPAKLETYLSDADFKVSRVAQFSLQNQNHKYMYEIITATKIKIASTQIDKEGCIPHLAQMEYTFTMSTLI